MKNISVDHLTRVEGNGGISATIDGNSVTDVKFSIYEFCYYGRVDPTGRDKLRLSLR